MPSNSRYLASIITYWNCYICNGYLKNSSVSRLQINSSYRLLCLENRDWGYLKFLWPLIIQALLEKSKNLLRPTLCWLKRLYRYFQFFPRSIWYPHFLDRQFITDCQTISTKISNCVNIADIHAFKILCIA